MRSNNKEGKNILTGLGHGEESLEKSEAELNFTLDLYKMLFDVSSDAMLITDAELQILHVNRAFCQITGYNKEEVLGKTPKILSSGRQDEKFYREMWRCINNQGCWQGELWNKKKNNEIFPVWQTINAVRPDNRIINYISVFSDISKLRETQQQLWQLAHYDPLTGLANRNLLEKQISRELAMVNRLHHYSGLLFIDLDDFKKINDSLGHKTGDFFLKQVGERLQREFREEDTISRIGGDEFVILLSNLSFDKDLAVSHITAAVGKLLLLLKKPFFIQRHELHISASIGITLLPRQGGSVDQLLRQADTAMYAAKHSGKNKFSFFQPQMQHEAEKRLMLEKELFQALCENQFDLLYQPQYDRWRNILGCEALVRWRHPEKGMISPAEFIPVAEENGLIVEIGERILLMACRQMKAWQKQGAHVPHLAINISPHQFADKDFVRKVIAVIHQSGANPEKIILEITEGLIIKNVNASIEKMNALKKLGVKFSIDDFGTGYSSLSYLSRLPIDQLKIDRSFVSNLEHNPNAAIIVDTIVAMARHLKLDLIAEGVETETQLNYLVRCGCHGFQGYYFSRPLPHEKIFSMQK